MKGLEVTDKHKVTLNCKVEGKLFLKRDMHYCSFHLKVVAVTSITGTSTRVVHVGTEISSWI